MSKITTRTGDDGTTGLADGSRVSKHALRIQCIGSVDELNSFVGVFLVELPDGIQLAAEFLRMQHDLFDLGGELAMSSAQNLVAVITKEHWQRLEQLVDKLNADLEPLENFILPGGSKELASCHVVRAVARRAERDLTELNAVEPVNEHAMKYLNRLSDVAFVAARWLAKDMDIPEVLWQQT